MAQMNKFQSFRTSVGAFFRPLRTWLSTQNKKLKKHPVLNFIVKAGLIVISLVFISIFALILSARLGLFGGMPSNDELANISNPEGTELYADDGKTLLGRYYIENRTNIVYDSLPENLIRALIATEDIRYYEHSGIDWKSWARVLWRTILLKEKASGGGSTISQQLAKNLFKRRTYWRGTTLINKVREIVIAQRLENMYSKEDLLTLYFNTVSFGGNVYGIDVAAKNYFNTTTRALKVEESATLVGMLKATTRYNPVNNQDLAIKRRNTVLDKMARYGYLTVQEEDSLKALPIKLNVVKETHTEGLATYFREYARQDLDKALANITKSDGSHYNIYTDGLKVYTSINLEMQDYAEKAVTEHMKELQDLYQQQLGWIKKPWSDTAFLNKAIKVTERYQTMVKSGHSAKYIDSVFNVKYDMVVYSPDGPKEMIMSPKDSLIYYLHFLKTGFLAADPSTGLIKAWVGGYDYRFFQYDHVTARRHVGSTMKPLVYAAALEKGLNPCDYYSNMQRTYKEYDDWRPRNFEGSSGGEYSMEGALTKSLNLATVDIMFKTGIDTVVDFAKKIGVVANIPSEPAVSLGAVDISLLEMLTAYGTFSNRGKKPTFTYIMKVLDADGNVILDNTVNPLDKMPQVMNPENADMIRKMMQTVVDAGTGGSIRWQYNVRQKLAGKTGTSQDCADGWFIGFNPHLIAGCWVGGEFPEIHLQGNFTGAFTALPIVGKFLNKVENNKTLKAYYSSADFPELSKEAKEALNCPRSKYVYVERDSTMLDSLGNPIYTDDMDEDGQDPFDESSKRDTTRKKNIIGRIFDNNKNKNKDSDTQEKNKKSDN